ncbi:hypothetical protein FNV43_RR10895 [Rhamnella rubrinervis]|uniref:histidine kinase n=1 Tax=Rhamnella rubrinervis TaxID=2594499 RepID=A0A8K0H4Y7_9ROSA|nr:hypothetical protein FNV43_RR10895 [Rhamnella rubrinervis]
MEDLSSTQPDYAQTAQACAKVLIALINEVLDWAKIDASNLELEVVSFDLGSILDDVISLFSKKFRKKGVEFATVVESSPNFSSPMENLEYKAWKCQDSFILHDILMFVSSTLSSLIFFAMTSHDT